MLPKTTLPCALLLSTLSVAACSSSAGAPAAPPAAAADAGVEDAAVADPPCDPPKVTFARSPVAIAPTRDHHVTFVKEVGGAPYLYVLGGEQDDFAIVLGDVLRSRIAADGSLSEFEKVGTIPRGRAGAALAVVGDDVVLVGGVVGEPKTGFTDEILVGRIDAGGRLDAWKAGPKLPDLVQHSTALVRGRDVLIFGGTRGNAATKISAKTAVSEAGELGALTPLTPLDTPRSHHVAFLRNDTVYLAGGLDKGPIGNPPSLSDVIRAKVNADGTIGAWEAAGTFAPLSVSAVEPVGCSLLFAGGLDESVKGGPYSNRVLRASVAKDGTFRAESPLEGSLSVKRGHVHQTPVYKGRFYSVAGRANDQSTLGTIDIGTIAQP